jgi:hypothetical protein
MCYCILSRLLSFLCVNEDHGNLMMCYYFLQMSSESDRESDIESKTESESDDVQIIKQHVELQASLFSTVSIIYKYFITYIDKNPPRTSILSGYAWVLETVDTPGESHRMFMMNERLFIQLHDLLVTNYGLKSSIYMNFLESLAIFLCIYGQNRSNTLVQNTFKYSGETISRKIDDVLRCLIKT